MAGVVVGVDHADSCRAAVGWASEAAALRGLPLALVHAWDELLDVTVDLEATSLPDLVAAATSCAAHGAAPEVLLARGADLLVLGGHRGARRLTSTTRACAHHATCPVVVVPDTEQSPTGRIAVGVCGTEASEAALVWAAQEAGLRHAELLVCCAWQVHLRTAHDLLGPTRAAEAQRSAVLARLRSWVQQVLGPQQVEVRLTRGAPLDVLLQAGTDADLVVVGHSVHPGPGGLLHGAVSDDLLGLAPCPVAVVPRRPAGAVPSPG